jgi:peptidylprolyl isomerase
MNQVFSPSLTAKQTSNAGGALPTVTAPAAGSTTGPTVTINTEATPPETLQVKVLAKGTGPVVKANQNIVVQYTGLIWRTGQVFQSSWHQGGPTSLALAGTVSGWKTGLAGQTVGSRVLLVIPPADGYGSAGNSQAGINSTDTLVFVVDILLAY